MARFFMLADRLFAALQRRAAEGGGTAERACYDTPYEDEFAYWLDLKNYDDLRDEQVEVKRILVVVLVPENLTEYLVEGEQQLAMRRCGYWLNLRGFPPTDNTTGQTVRISRTQRFTVESLQGIMERIGQGLLP